MAEDIAIWDSDQVFHFLSSEHVSTRVRQLLLDAGLDGDMLLTFDKQDYVELQQTGQGGEVLLPQVVTHGLSP